MFPWMTSFWACWLTSEVKNFNRQYANCSLWSPDEEFHWPELCKQSLAEERLQEELDQRSKWYGCDNCSPAVSYCSSIMIQKRLICHKYHNATKGASMTRPIIMLKVLETNPILVKWHTCEAAMAVPWSLISLATFSNWLINYHFSSSRKCWSLTLVALLFWAIIREFATKK